MEILQTLGFMLLSLRVLELMQSHSHPCPSHLGILLGLINCLDMVLLIHTLLLIGLNHSLVISCGGGNESNWIGHPG